MVSINVTDRGGVDAIVAMAPGQSVMQALRDQAVGEIEAICGGGCACATCHIYVDADFLDRLPGISGDEDELLDMSEHRQPNSRLSCQIAYSPALDGMHITVAPED